VLEQTAVGDLEAQSGVFDGALVSVVRINHEVKANDLPAELKDLDQVFQQQAEAVKGRLQPPQDGELGGLPARQYVIEFVSAQGDLLASAQTVTCPIGSPAHQSTRSSSLFAPARWPAPGSPSPLAVAQRRLPSRITATCRGSGRRRTCARRRLV
jgi:hypothetical protein